MSAVAFWPRTTQRNVASYRIRCAQIRTALAGMGMETDLIDPRGPSPDAPAPRVVVMVKNFGREALDRAFAWRAASGTRLILDICDNPFFEGAAGKRPGADPGRLAADLDRADLIVTPSTYLREAIASRLRPDMRFVVIPDAVEEPPAADLATRLVNARSFFQAARLPGRLRKAAPAGRRLIWYGLSGTAKARNGLYDLETYADILNAHHAREPVSLTIVTDRPWRHRAVISRFRCATFAIEWNRWTIDRLIAEHDIALIPIRLNDYNLAKSANRVTTAFANGAAVCATAIPSYEPFRGVACLDDWEAGLAALMASPEARRESVRAGREIVDRDYSLAVIAARWKTLLTGMLEEETIDG